MRISFNRSNNIILSKIKQHGKYLVKYRKQTLSFSDSQVVFRKISNYILFDISLEIYICANIWYK